MKKTFLFQVFFHAEVASEDKTNGWDLVDVLTGLFASWDAIGRLLDGLPDDDWDAPTPLPGWQVRDVLAHIAGTEAMLLGMSPAEPDVDVSARPRP